MTDALKALDKRLTQPLRLIMGGGGAMILAHGYPLATTDIDAIAVNMSIEELDPLVKAIARELNLPGDWLNPYFSTFSHVLPPDYGQRLIVAFKGRFLQVDALGKEDLLIMKCFAHRSKDIGHAKSLIKNQADLRLVEGRIMYLAKIKTKGAKEALDFLDDLVEEVDESS